MSSTHLGGGHPPRTAIGTVSRSEFLVTFAISAAFMIAILRGVFSLDFRVYATEIAGLIAARLVAAPLAGFVARLAPARYLPIAVGIVVLGLAVW